MYVCMYYVRMNIHVYAVYMYVHTGINTRKNSRAPGQYLVSGPLRERTTCNYVARLADLFIPLTCV